jgi:hypothetical protein
MAMENSKSEVAAAMVSCRDLQGHRREGNSDLAWVDEGFLEKVRERVFSHLAIARFDSKSGFLIGDRECLPGISVWSKATL